MSDLFPDYNTALQDVAAHYQGATFASDQTFAVVFQPLLVDIMSFPIEAIRFVASFINAKKKMNI